MDYTNNYNLVKPAKSQKAWDILVNDNFDKIDGEIKNTNDKIGDISQLDSGNVVAELESHASSLAEKTADTDDARTTTNKTVTGAINELNINKADKTEVNTLATNKVDKGGNEQVTLAMLAQEVKTAMTGGSVAVVEGESVNTSNIVPKAVTPERTSFISVIKNLLEYGYNTLDASLVSDVVTGPSASNRVMYIPCKANTTYIISKVKTTYFAVATTETEPTYNTALIGKIDQGGERVNALTITTDSTSKYLVIWYYNVADTSYTEQDIINSMKVYEGSEIPSITGNFLKEDIKVSKSSLNFSFPQELFVNPFKSDKTIITIIDDDGKKTFNSRIKPLLDARSIKCSLGVITSSVGSDSSYMTLDEIKALYNSGFDILSHTHTHSADIYKSTTTDLSTVPDDVILNDMSLSYKYLLANGLATETIVYPWGNFPTTSDGVNQKIRYTELAKKVGFQFGVNAFGTTMNDKVLDNMYLDRLFITDNVTLDVMKARIDSCIANNGWLILGMHSNDTTNMTDAFLTSVLDYIISTGVTVLPFKDANAIKKNIASVGVYGSSTGSLYIGRNGVVKN